MGIKVIKEGNSTFAPGTAITSGAISGLVRDRERRRTVVVLLGRRFGSGGQYTTCPLEPSLSPLDPHGSCLGESSNPMDIKPGEEVTIGSLQLRGF